MASRNAYWTFSLLLILHMTADIYSWSFVITEQHFTKIINSWHFIGVLCDLQLFSLFLILFDILKILCRTLLSRFLKTQLACIESFSFFFLHFPQKLTKAPKTKDFLFKHREMKHPVCLESECQLPQSSLIRRACLMRKILFKVNGFANTNIAVPPEWNKHIPYMHILVTHSN